MVAYRIPSIMDVFIMPGKISDGYTYKQVDFYTSFREKRFLQEYRSFFFLSSFEMFSVYEIFQVLLNLLARKIRTNSSTRDYAHFI